MRIKLFLIALLISTFCQAQFLEQSSKTYEQTLNANTLVVLRFSDSLNNKIKTAFTKYWKATPYQFVDSAYVEALRVEKNGPRYNVFDGRLWKTMVEKDPFANKSWDTKGSFANWWSYYLIPLKPKEKPDLAMATAWGPINLLYYEWDHTHPFENTFHRIDFIIKQMNDVLQFVEQNKKADPGDYEEAVNKKAIALKNKTLLIPKELLQEYDIWKITVEQMEAGVGKVYTPKKPIFKRLVNEEVLENYKGKYTILPYAEIDRLAASAEASQYALFSPVVVDRKYIFVFDLATKEMIYSDNASMSMEVNKKNLKALNEKAGLAQD